MVEYDRLDGSDALGSVGDAYTPNADDELPRIIIFVCACAGVIDCSCMFRCVDDVGSIAGLRSLAVLLVVDGVRVNGEPGVTGVGCAIGEADA